MDRKNIGFLKEIANKFSFLIDQYNYKIKYEDNYYVCFTKKNIIIEMYHERISYEIYCCIGSAQNNKRMELGEFLRGQGIENVKTSFQASNREAVVFCLTQIANTLSTYCKQELEGEEYRI